MLDTLEIFGDEFTSVAGIKATNDNNETVIFLHLAGGDNLGYGITDGSIPKVGIAKVGSAHVWGDNLPMMVFGTGQIGTGRVV